MTVLQLTIKPPCE